MGDFKVVEGADKVGAWTIKYNGLVDEVIESVNTVDDGVNITITYNKIGGGIFKSVVNKSNVVTGKTYNELLDLSLDNELIPGNMYELPFNTIDYISNTNITYTGVTENLLLTAINKRDFHAQVVSKEFPQDIIYFDFTNNGFQLPNGNTLGRKGYIYYRHDTLRNLKVSGYDFRNHIMYRYPVDTRNYNQYNPATTYSTGSYVWRGDWLYVYNKSVGAGTSPDESNSVSLIQGNYYLTTTGTTNYGTTVATDILLYPILSGVTSGYTFGTTYNTNNYNANIVNIEITSNYNYNGWKPSYDYLASNHTHKPNIVLWGTISNSKFSDSVSNITFSNSSATDLYMDNCYNVNLIGGTFTNVTLSKIGNSIFTAGNVNLKAEYNNNILVTTANTNLSLLRSQFSFIGNNTNCNFNELKYSNIGYGGGDNIINKFYFSRLYNSSSYNNITNAVNSYIKGTYNNVSDSFYISVGMRDNGLNPYETANNNIIKQSSYINLYGSNNEITGSRYLGTTTGIDATTGGTDFLFSEYSTYKPGCQNISTYLSTGQINGCTFGEKTSNIRLLNHNVGLTNCSFAPGTKNISFGTDSGNNSRPYANITTSLPYTGIKVSPIRPNITITKLEINNTNFVGLNETNDLVGLSFTGGTTPVYTSIESFQ